MTSVIAETELLTISFRYKDNSLSLTFSSTKTNPNLSILTPSSYLALPRITSSLIASKGHTMTVKRLVWSAADDLLISAGMDGNVYGWSLLSGTR